MKPLVLAPLPYEYNALEGVISEKIMQLHHDKHHQAYVTGANAALEKLEKARKGELEINVKETMRDLSFHFSGHVLHQNFWEMMRKPSENNLPSEDFNKVRIENFGSFEAFKKEFTSAAINVEGSGWAVLAQNGSNLYIHQLEKHNLLSLPESLQLLVLDVWEHAYYLDYLNDRKTYVEKWWSVVNWDNVASRLFMAKSK